MRVVRSILGITAATCCFSAAVAGFGAACGINLDVPDECDGSPTIPANAAPSYDGGLLDLCPSGWMCNAGYSACGGTPCGVNLLRDPANCGVCGNSCRTSCVEGSCAAATVLADGLGGPGNVAVDASYVYVMTATNVVRIPKAGGAAETGPAVQTNGVGSMAADDSGVYWLDTPSHQLSLYSLSSWPSGVSTLAQGLGLGTFPLWLDDAYAYGMAWFASPPVDDAGYDDSFVWRVPKTGGPAQPIAALSQVWVYDGDQPLSVTGSGVAFADGQSIRAVIDGGAPTTVATQVGGVEGLAADDTWIYWTPSTSGPPIAECLGGLTPCPSTDGAGVADGVYRVSWSGGTVAIVSPVGGLVDLRVSPGALWGLSGLSTVGGPWPLVRVDIATGNHTVFAGGLPIGGYALDAANVYWTSGNEVLVAPLP